MTHSNEFLVFNIYNENYAIDINKVYEVLRVKEIIITKVPKVPNYIEGIMNIRGQVIPLVNLRVKLGFKKKNVDKKSRVIIVNVEGKKIGILVDKILKVFNFCNSKLFSCSEHIREKCEYVVGLYKKDNCSVFVIDISSLLNIE